MLHLIWLLLFLTSCSYTYIPPIPNNVQLKESRLELHTSPGLSTENERLQLDLLLYNVPEEAWLAVQWLEPLGKEVASESKWVIPEDTGTELTFELPADIEMEYGFWRAVVSSQGELIRQFSLEATPPSKSPPRAAGGFQEDQIIE